MLADCCECAKPISTSAARCPYCGYDYTSSVIDSDSEGEYKTFKVISDATVETESGNKRRMFTHEFEKLHNKIVMDAAREMDRNRESASSGCFIATAAYGTPLASEVCVLRQFRDERLVHSRLGKAFAAAYYRFSPPVAKVVSRNSLLAAVVRSALHPLIWLLRNGR